MLDSLIGPYREIAWVLPFWPILVFAFVAALPGTWLCKQIALKFGVVDKPDGSVKTHKQPVAYLGGIGILLGFAAGVLAGMIYLDQSEMSRAYLKLLIGILAGASVACFVGIVDDLLDIKPYKKLLGQIVAAVILISVGIKPNISAFLSPFGIEIPGMLETILVVPIVIFFVLGATNSLNLLDGLDGLCAGVTVIITVAMLLLSIHLATWNTNDIGDPIRLTISLALLGAVLGFLPFNRHPAKIFMGDAGSMLLGFVVAAMMILFASRSPRWWMASILVLGLPILDTAVALVRRLLNKRPLFVSDRGHIYDQLIDRGIPLKKTVRICYLLSGLYALSGMVLTQLRTRYAGLVFLIVIIISAVIVWKKGFLKMEGLRGVVRKEITN
ncbi:MAG: undecaprenyl/decaprenyl-phosphate alpha-N-acetylglucosaminyl 1-phosphate transferase [Anaerohalosphaeraceae bacterium]|nr:undecaprenyl/decaprenyl-phosphate alpha-N-acetylglucosaminyl 1-phosphate transferase [Anaerohalosphaeraceae bacterium]